MVAQTGPGGIGNAEGSNGEPKLEMWYDASDIGLANNTLISSWMDKSGNGNNISQAGDARPTYKNSTDANYSFSSVRFDGADDFLPIDGSVLVNTNYTVIVVGARRSNGLQAIMGGSTGTTNQNFHPYFNTNQLHSHQWGNDHNANYTGGAGSTVNATTPNFGVFAFRLNSNLGSAQRAMFQNGQLIGTSNNNAQLTSYTGAALGRIEAINSFSRLDLAEVIIYSTALSEPQLAIVNNYLSSKYNLNMNSNDYYAGDTPANNNFDLNVTGIGQLGGVKVNTSSSQGVLLEGGTGLNANGEFLLMGSDATVNGISTSNLGATVQARWNKTWYFDKTGNLDAKISFDLIEGIGGLYPAGDKNNYVLLRLNGGNYNIVPLNAADKALLGSKVEFTVSNANLTDGFYTLGTTNSAQSPLDGQPNQTWYSYQTGNWNNPLTWTTDGSGLDRAPAGGGIPDASDNVVILSGKNVTMDANNIVVASMEVNGVLDVAATSGHNFITIAGNGTIRLSGSSSIDNFPAGNTTDFADDFTGGTVEYYGSGLSLNQNRIFNNLVLNLNNTTNELVLLSNLSLNGDLTLTRGRFKINDNSATNILNLTVEGDAIVEADASIRVGQGNTIGSFSIPGTMPAVGNYHSIFHQVTFRGDFVNNGSVRFTNQASPVYNQFTSTGAATVRFEGLTNNTASLFGITDFYNLVIDKGIDQTYELEITSSNINNFNLFGPNTPGRVSNGGFTQANPEVRKALWIYNGTLHLTGDILISTLTEGSAAGGNGDYPVGANAGLWIDGPNVSVYTTADNTGQVPSGAVGVNTGGGNQALSLYGRFRISDGFFGTRGSAGFIFWNDNAGEVLIEGGTVNVSQFRSGAGGPGIYTYTQTGGNVLVRSNEGQNGEVDGNFALFSLQTTDAVFNMSGGTLTVYGNNGEAIFINSSEGNYNVTGGTVIVENRNNNSAIIASTVPFWNLTLRKDQAGDADEIDLITSESGGTTITNPNLKVLNNFFIGPDIIFDHNGNDVEVGSDFTVSVGATYVFDENKKNTLTISGVDNSKIALLNISGGGSPGAQQRFYNLTINKLHGKVVSLQSSKTGGNLNGFNNNLFRVDGEAFKVLSGTLDQGFHSILVNCDTLINYDVLTVYNEALGPTGPNGTDSNANGNNDQLKLASNQGTPTDIVIITADTAVIGNLKFFMQNNIVTLNSDLTIQYLQHNNGRLNIQDNNLRVFYYNENPPDGVQQGSLTNMIVTNGQPSDGGLTLAIRANRTYTFQVGIGLTGSSPSSKYTPATAEISNISDDGFITIRPVDRVLATTLNTGGNILSYYWRVNHEGFSTLPNVIYTYKYNQDDVDGAGNETSFVAGKVLEEVPYTRNYEDDNIPQNEGVNATTNTITFNGPTDSGFTVENASYTAGINTRFVGAPMVYYSTTASSGNDTDFGNNDKWNDSNRWSTEGHYSTTNTGTFPQTGDIAIMGFGLRWSTSTSDNNQRSHWYFIDSDVDVAKLVFAKEVENRDGIKVPRASSYPPQLIVDDDRNLTINFGTVEGLGTFNLEVNCIMCSANPNISVPVIADVTGDFGLFASEDGSRFDYDLVFGNNRAVRLPSTFPTVYPNLHIKGRNGTGRTLLIAQDITVKRDLILREGAILRLNDGGNGDIVVKRNLNLSVNNRDETLEFSSTGTNRTLRIDGNIITNTNDRIRVLNNTPSSLVHKFQLGGSIIQSAGTSIDLFNGLGNNNNAILELVGGNSANYSRSGTNALDLFQLVMNKETKSTEFIFDDSFTLGATTDGETKALTITRGTLTLNDPAIDINLTTGGANFVIPSSGVLMLTSGVANASGDDSGIFLDGSLNINGGTLDMSSGAGNGNNFIEYSASGSASLSISSGSLLVGSQIRRGTATTAGILNYVQTGGTVEVGRNVAPEASRGVFEIVNTGSNFSYTGGTLTLVRQNTASPSVAALRLLPSSSTVTSTIFIGNANTPANQNNFGVNANIPLAGLEITGTNSPTAILQVNPLTLNGQLLINNGGSLDANGLDLILNADFVNDGSFIPSGNETIFASTGNQSFNGTGTTSFFQFTKSSGGLLNVEKDITVLDLFTISGGTLNDNGNTIDLKSNALIDGVHESTVSGNGIQFSADVQQQLLRSEPGTGNLGLLTIVNPVGVIIPEANGFNFNINNGLRMNGGVFNIGSSKVTIGVSANITTNSGYSETNMIKTNSSFTDNGLTKVFPSGYNQLFTYPIGEDDYTPAVIDFTVSGGTSGTTLGSISVKPANEYHPTVNDSDDILASGDINNVLQYYWTLQANGINDLVASVRFQYDQSDVSIAEGGYTEEDYIAARVLLFDNPMENINKFTASAVDESLNQIVFNQSVVFNGVGSNGISGDYFAGIDEAIPNNIATYTSTGTGGNVNSTATFIETLPTDGVAPSGSILIVSTGTEVDFNVNNVRLYKTIIEDGGVLNVDQTDGHRLGILEGTGTLKITSNTNNASLPAADYADFFSCTGGGLEYAGTGSYNVLPGITALRRLTLSGSGNRNFPNNDVEICEDLNVEGPLLLARNNRRINIRGNVLLSGGEITPPAGSSGRFNVFGNNLTIDGGTFNGRALGFTNVVQDLIIASGTLNVGTSNYRLRIGRNFNYTGGVFDGGSGNSSVEFTTFSALVDDSQISGNFTGTNSFFNVVIDKSGSGRNVFVNSDIQVDGQLTLTSGLIVSGNNKVFLGATSTVSPADGRNNSYITGKVTKVISSAGENFTFPIGNIYRWRPATVNNVSNAGLTWEAQYFTANPTSHPLVDNLTPSSTATATISDNEYWIISDGPSAPAGVTASIGLSWGIESEVSDEPAERQELQVLAWNNATSSWDNFGGGNFSSGNTQSQGSFLSASDVTFSERVITLGSGDASNPLPVELVYFTAENRNTTVDLEWQTASEFNNDFFEVQRSFDGKSFEVIGLVEGNGTVNQLINYGFTDYSPLAGETYYRLRQVDYNGDYEFSPIAKVNREELSDLALVPNPTSDQAIYLRLSGFHVEQPVQVKIFDLQGKLYYFNNHSPNELQQRPLPVRNEMHAGIYLVEVVQGNTVKQVRLAIR
ncbi:hypothetical protein GCM10011506_02560 [Marivirga lumbricoides]|uniref:Secretion system C-terminal sorting domain-containing protein n=1 Tax=Marivirga lumbricoides TaxID=1046115 RepID=A0ABQ1LAH9_9BACT|nr:hypothetical protein GCM10011506_02560 [Marivirga lumbricoides]